jgi:hypothetical protein
MATTVAASKRIIYLLRTFKLQDLRDECYGVAPDAKGAACASAGTVTLPQSGACHDRDIVW